MRCAPRIPIIPSVTGQTLIVSDPGKGVIANDSNVYGVQLVAPVAGLTLNANGTFTYSGPPTSFTYCANGTVTAGACSSGFTATVTLGAAPAEAAGNITVVDDTYTATVANALSIKSPGILLNDKDSSGYPLTVNLATPTLPRLVAAPCTGGRSGAASVSVDAERWLQCDGACGHRRGNLHLHLSGEELGGHSQFRHRHGDAEFPGDHRPISQ